MNQQFILSQNLGIFNETPQFHLQHQLGDAMESSSSSCGVISPQPKHCPQHIDYGNEVLVDRINATTMVPSSSTGSWPHHMATEIAESIQQKVRKMLAKSRLVRKTSKIQFLKPSDILQVHSLLGVGAFSQVSCVTARTRPHKRYACKHLKQELMADTKGFLTAASELAYEAHMLSSLDHPNIIRIHGWAANGIASFEEGKHNSFFLLLDLLDATLDQRIEHWKIEVTRADTNPHVRQFDKLRALSEIASALDYIHSQGVVFRDLKPQNIGFLKERSHSPLTSPKFQVKLFDFGLSRELPTLNTTEAFKMSGKVGTIRYMAPEVCLYQPYGIACDIYSWSMVAYEILSQSKPFEGFTPEMYCSLVCQQHVRPCDAIALQYSPFHRNNSFEETIPYELFVLLEHAWNPIPCQRAGLGTICAQLSLLSMKEQLLLEAQGLHALNLRQSDDHSVTTTCASVEDMMTSLSSMLEPPPPPPPPPPVPMVSPDMHHPSHDVLQPYAQISHARDHRNFPLHQSSLMSFNNDHGIKGNIDLEAMMMKHHYQQQQHQHQQEMHYMHVCHKHCDYQSRKECNSDQEEMLAHVVDLTKDDEEQHVIPVTKNWQPLRKTKSNNRRHLKQQQHLDTMGSQRKTEMFDSKRYGGGSWVDTVAPRWNMRQGNQNKTQQIMTFDDDHFGDGHSMRTVETDTIEDDDNILFEW